MNSRYAVLVLVSALLVGSCTLKKEETPTSGSVRFAVAESQVALMQQEVDEFHRLYPDARVELVPTTTRGAVVLLLNDSIRFICTDRALNQEEIDVAGRANLEYRQLRVAEDGLAIIVNRENPMLEIRQSTLRDIVSGRITSWSGVPESKWNAPVTLALTGKNSGTYELLVRHFLHLETDIQPGYIGETQADITKFVTSTPGAIGVVGAAAIRDTSLNIRALAVESIDSTSGQSLGYVRLHQANIYRSLYPLHYPVYFYSTAPGKSVATGFTTFVAGNAGQKIVQNSGLSPATVPVRLVQLKQE